MAIDHDRVEGIFNAAVALASPAQRAAYLDNACAHDSHLRERVEALLASHDSADSFLARPLDAAGARTIGHAAAPLAEAPGARIGRYKLLQLIGEGGFGSVFMAEQEHPVRRKVALKIIKLGMDTRQVIARFEAERQALAMMDHPNIARVLDAGATDTGRPYFVMELVRGVPITEYCDTNNLPTRERLELFGPVCHAVQHAHQKGIIHRDIKPSNILVTMADGSPIPKVIDFGIAKATSARLTEMTLFTEFRQLVGTPEYMSPEQAEMSGIDVDTRTDVYSLGVLLYELLTGTTPFDAKELRSRAYAEIQRMIREVEPPRPSTRISGLGKTLAATAAHRRIEPRKLGPLMRGELDWIVMRAMEKDRTRRYETANGLAMDVKRYLENEPVTARPASTSYRLRKFASKHKVGFAAAAAVAAALVLGVAGTTLMMFRATRERDRAVTLSGELDRQRREALDAKTRAERAQAQAERDRAVIEASEADARQTLAHSRNLFSCLWDLAAGAGRDPDMTVRELLDRTLAEIDLRQVPYHPRPESAIRHALGTAYHDLGRLAEAETQLRRAARLREGWVGLNHRAVAGWGSINQRALAVSLMELGGVLADQGKCDEALPALQRALELLQLDGVSSAEALTTLRSLQRVSVAKGDHSNAAQYAQTAAEVRRRLGLDDSVPELTSTLERAHVRRYRNDYSAAERLLRDAIALHRQVKAGQDDYALIAMHHQWGCMLIELGRFGDAEPAFREALAVSQRLLGGNCPEAAAMLGKLAGVLRAQHKEDEARAAELRSLAIEIHLVGDTLRENPAKASLYYERGKLLSRAGRFREALPDFTKAIELEPAEREMLAFTAPVYLYAGDIEGYRRVCRRMVERLETPKSPELAEWIAKALLTAPDPQGDLDLCSQLIEHAVAQGESHQFIDWFRTAQGLLEYRRGRYEQAAHLVQRLPEKGRMHAYGRGLAGLVLAMAHARAGRNDQARRTLTEVEARLDALSATPGTSDLVDFSDWCTYQLILSQARSVVNGPAKDPR